MLKSTVAFSLVATLLTLVPAQAQMMKMTPCTDANMMKMQDDIEKMTDATKKEMAMKEASMAKDSMGKKNDKDCMMHMKKAEDMMPKM
jgi:uncharacterized protein YycO